MDREQIIYDIERCTCHVPDACRDCSHYTGTVGFECMENLMKDVLDLLKKQEEEAQNLYRENHNILTQFHEWAKEQKAVKPVRDKQTGRLWLCGKCGSYVGFEDNDPHDPNEYDKYCRECGRPVLWEGR